MNRLIISVLVAVLSFGSLTGCATKLQGTALGAGVGGAAGYAIGGGTGAAIGAIGGGVAGNVLSPRY